MHTSPVLSTFRALFLKITIKKSFLLKSLPYLLYFLTINISVKRTFLFSKSFSAHRFLTINISRKRARILHTSPKLSLLLLLKFFPYFLYFLTINISMKRTFLFSKSFSAHRFLAINISRKRAQILHTSPKLSTFRALFLRTTIKKTFY